MKFRNSQRGVALILTLIMLAIITVVVVVFLATARRNRQSTTLRQHQTDAEFAAEYAFQRAGADIMKDVLRDTNLLAFDFLVSRGANVPTVTNRAGTIDVYLDLDRDGIFTDPRHATNAPYGDPMWIGVLDKPERLEAADNKYIARMAYAILPAGKSLDLNTIHNAAAPQSGNSFMRNQGFGPWEINLAAFFAELNPDVWWEAPNSGQRQYSYGPFPQPTAAGDAFEDAKFITEYRRGWEPSIRAANPLAGVFPSAYGGGAVLFPPSSIDAYGDGNAGFLGANPFTADDDFGNVNKLTRDHWFGSDPTNHWFNHQELFDNTSYKVTNDFLTNLIRAIHGYQPDNIRPTPRAFYKIMSQLTMDSGSDYHDRINLNYAALGTNSAEDFIPWDANPELAVTFFTNVAERIFRAQSNEFNNLSTNQLPIRSITQIPIYPTNLYSTAIHRILQQAANIFDAALTNVYPSVFRPVFGSIGTTRYIVGYEFDDRVSTLQPWLNANTNGIPLVIGAKKGFPNFNEFTLRSDSLVSRKLEVQRPPNAARGTRPTATNQMYVLGISNYFGVEAWNPYDAIRSGPYPRGVRITVSNIAVMSLTNALGFQMNSTLNAATETNLNAGTWSGGQSMGFIVPFDTNMVFLSNGVYRFTGNVFTNVGLNDFERSISGFPLPYWVYTISNRLSYLMSEPHTLPNERRIVDFVLLQDTHTTDLFRDLVGAVNPYRGITGVSAAIGSVWNTNRTSPNAPTTGIRQQMDIALGNVNLPNSEWRAFGLATTLSETDKQKAIDAFRVFCGLGPLTTNQVSTNSTTEMQAPFNPAAKLSVLSSWQANDPIVHYHVTDLRMMDASTNHQYLKPSQPATNVAPSSLGRLNDSYSPWGGRPNSSFEAPNAYDLALKDPGVTSPDEWQFPTNKLASVGMLGRIHRGTPWQTVYFKSEAAPIGGPRGWTNQSSDMVLHASGQVFSRTHATNDWKLADMFTTAINERTSRGLMSVNQTNMESWSALLSGVTVLSNSVRVPVMGQVRQYENLFIEPWGSRPFDQSHFAMIWSNIYWLQRFPPNLPPRPLRSVGDILQVPQLTVQSPFLNQTGDQVKWGLDDFAYERIPQQILSLLRVGQSRFVIYAYGQALKPVAINPANGRVQNYQVTAEYATRTVVRAEGDPRSRVRLVVESFNVLPPD